MPEKTDARAARPKRTRPKGHAERLNARLLRINEFVTAEGRRFDAELPRAPERSDLRRLLTSARAAFDNISVNVADASKALHGLKEQKWAPARGLGPLRAGDAVELKPTFADRLVKDGALDRKSTRGVVDTVTGRYARLSVDDKQYGPFPLYWFRRAKEAA